MMKTDRRKIKATSKIMFVALGLPLGVSAQAWADDTPQPQISTPQSNAQTPVQAKVAEKKAQNGTVVVAQASVPPAQGETQSGALMMAAGSPDRNAERVTMADNPKASPSSQARSNGFIGDSHLTVNLRNYADQLDMQGGPHRHAWIQAAQVNYESGFTQGLIGFGVDATMFGAFKLDGGAGAGNFVHVGKDGGGSNQLAWAYPGMYDVKARISDTVVKYGLQQIVNPFMEPHDNRALPPTFLGVSVVSKDVANMSLEGGSFTKADDRGHTNLSNLISSYGGVRIDRLSYVGGSWDYAKDGSLSLYADQADNVWRQYYASVKQSFGDPSTIKWTGFGNVYSTHNAGDALEGHIDNNAVSFSISAQHGPHSILFGYQRILGDQFFDYVNETNGIYLVNSMDVDYNAPHEQSFQARYTFDGKYAGLPGAKAMFWYLTGWGADGSAEAQINASEGSALHGLYWKNGQPVHGTHHEFGFVPSYTLQNGRFKDTKITFIAMWHHGSKYYSDPSNMEYRLVIDMPIKVF
jgi:hypothetical protein